MLFRFRSKQINIEKTNSQHFYRVTIFFTFLQCIRFKLWFELSYNFWQKASLTDLLHYIDFFKWQHWPKWNKKSHKLNNKFNLIAVFLFVKDTRLSNFSFIMAVFAQCFSTNRLLLWAYAYTQFHFQQIMKVKIQTLTSYLYLFVVC